MQLDSDDIGVVHEKPIDTADTTIALFSLPRGSIERSLTTDILVDPDEAFDFRVDVGVRPAGVDEITQESDLHWFNGVINKSKSDNTDEIETFEATETALRIVVTAAAATAGATANIAATIGR